MSGRYKRRSSYGLVSGPQTAPNPTRKPGGRVTKRDAFPESEGNQLSNDPDQSSYRRSANSGSARLARAIAGDARKDGGNNSNDEEQQEESDELEEDDDDVNVEEEEELNSDDLDNETSNDRNKFKRNKLEKARALEKKIEEERKKKSASSSNGKGVGSSSGNKAADAAQARLNNYKAEVITISDSDDEDLKPIIGSSNSKSKFKKAPKKEEDLSEYSIRDLEIALARKRKENQSSSKSTPRASTSTGSSSSNRKSSRKPLFNQSSAEEEDADDSDELPDETIKGRFTSSSSKSKPKSKSTPTPIKKKQNTTTSNKTKPGMVEGVYSEAVTMQVPSGIYKRPRSPSVDNSEIDELDSTTDEDNNGKKGKGKAVQKTKKKRREMEIVAPESDDEEREKFEDVLHQFDLMDRGMIKKKKKYRTDRAPGYSNPRRN